MFPVVVLLANLLGALPQQPETGVLVSMTVCTRAGEPLTQAVAHVADADFTSEALAALPGTRADAHGHIEVRGPAEQGRMLVVTAPGHTTRELPIATRDLGFVILFPAVERTGRVRDERGGPLTGVRVCAADPLAPVQLDGRYASAALTDERGYFRLRGALPGNVELTFTKWGRHGTVLYPVRGDTPVDVVLAAAPVVAGRIAGMPAGARLELDAECPDLASAAARLAGDGSFEMFAPERGRYRVVVEHFGDRIAASDLLRGAANGLLLAAGPDHPLEVRLTLAGKPVPEFWIQTSWDAGAKFDQDSPPPRHGTRHVEGDVVTLTVPGWVTRGELWIGGPGAATRRAVLADATVTDRKYDLDAGGAVTGRAVDAATRQPLAGVRVEVSGFQWQFEATTADGRFRIDGLRAGDHSVRAVGPEDTNGADTVATVRAGEVHDVGDLAVTADVDVLRGQFGDASLPRLARVQAVRPRAEHGGHSSGPWSGIVAGPVPVDAATKGFTLRAVRRDCELELLVPAANALGPDLVFPIGPATRSPEVQRFAVIAVPGTIRGSVKIAGTAEPLALRVVATSDRFLPAAVADVDAGGNYELQLPDGAWLVHLVELRTGIRFVVPQDAVALRAGATVAHDLNVTVHEVAVSVRVAEGAAATSVQLATRSEDPQNFEFFDYAYREVPLLGSTALRFWLPPGEYRAVAIDRPLVRRLRHAPTFFEVRRTPVEFSVERDQPASVEVVVPPPPATKR